MTEGIQLLSVTLPTMVVKRVAYRTIYADDRSVLWWHGSKDIKTVPVESYYGVRTILVRHRMSVRLN